MPRLPGQIIHLIARLSAFKFIVLGISLENWSGCITTPRWYLLLLSLNHLFLTLNRLVNGPKWQSNKNNHSFGQYKVISKLRIL